jgi:hypothetical protein
VDFKLGIAIPWRPQPSRIYAFNAIVEKYKKDFVDVPIYYGDFPSERWNVSGSRNLATQEAFDAGCDVVLVSDADFFMPPMAIMEGAEKALKRQKMVIPFSNLYFCDEAISKKLIEGDIELNLVGRYLPVYRRQVAGSNILTRQVFETMNGWDERFNGWGYEDVAFVIAHETLIGDVIRINNYAGSLYHDDRDKELVEVNREHAKLYELARGNQTKMRELVAGNRLNVS